jgi:hypothetical protein
VLINNLSRARGGLLVFTREVDASFKEFFTFGNGDVCELLGLVLANLGKVVFVSFFVGD